MSLSNLISDALLRSSLSDKIKSIKSDLKENEKFYENVINDKSVSIKETRKCFDIYNNTKRQLEEELNNIRTLL